MSLNRIKAVFLQQIFLTRRSMEMIMDLFFISLMLTIVFGFISQYLSNSLNPEAGKFIFVGTLLWEIIRINQYATSVLTLWNIWSKNLNNMFITPLSLREYLFAQMFTGAVYALIPFLILSILIIPIFNFNIFDVGLPNLIFYFINLTIFAWSIGIFALGLIIRYGTKIQAVAWGIVYIFQPLTAVYFPLNILPQPLQYIALSLPATYVFESARKTLTNPSFDFNNHLIALILNLIYLGLTLYFFNFMFSKAKEVGQLAKNES
jgi:ABC-2 type transport system permease protein